MATSCSQYCTRYRIHRIVLGTKLYWNSIFANTRQQRHSSGTGTEQNEADNTNADTMDDNTMTLIGKGVFYTIIAVVCLIPGLILTFYGEYGDANLIIQLVGGVLGGIGSICLVISCVKCMSLNRVISSEEYRIRQQANRPHETAPPNNEEEENVLQQETNIFISNESNIPTSGVPSYHDVVRPDDVTASYDVESDVNPPPPSYDDVIFTRAGNNSTTGV
ncbi:uncharacterized protein LOC144435926 [Glandiceps talaboti]